MAYGTPIAAPRTCPTMYRMARIRIQSLSIFPGLGHWWKPRGRPHVETWSSTVSHVLQDPQHLCIGQVCSCLRMYSRLHLQRWPGGSTRGWLRVVSYGRCRFVAHWGPHTKSIGDLSTFVSSTRPQVSTGVEYVLIRVRKQNFLSRFLSEPQFWHRKVRCHANTKINTVQPYNRKGRKGQTTPNT